MSIPINLDLFFVGLAIAAIGILGFIVFWNNRRSITAITFLLFSLTTIVWGVVNYFAYQVSSVELSLWLFRLEIFFATWHAFFIFQLFNVFPGADFKFSKIYKLMLIPLVGATAVLTLTPLVFSSVGKLSATGKIDKIINGPGIILFAAVVLFLIIYGIVVLLRKIFKAGGVEKKQFIIVFIGTAATFILLLTFNFILPAFFNNPNYIALGPVFFFPFIAFTSYAILRHHLLNIKIITTEILTFILAIVTLVEIIFANDLTTMVFRSGIFLLALSFGILLIKSVRREVEQRERLESLSEDLAISNSKLKQLDKLKSEFLSFASHQIKSPIAIIKGFASLIADGSYGEVSEKIKSVALNIKDASDRLIILVNNFLDLRRIEEGRMEYHFEPADIVAIVKRISEDMKILAKNKNLDLSFGANCDSLNSQVDVLRFSQIIQNLIDNAIKYTDKGWVKVSLKYSDKKEILITVSDSGRGISPEFKNQIFTQFSRDSAAAKLAQGTGLGLFIAKQIVQAHHGEIWVESEGEGKGSSFYIKLPQT